MANLPPDGVFPPVTTGNALMTPPLRPADPSSVLGQIESSADYYGPQLYADLLKFYSNFSAETDSNVDFIPVTQTKANPKLFVVGLIPPSVNVTGRLLDRSASVANVTGAPAGTDPQQEAAAGSGQSNVATGAGNGAGTDKRAKGDVIVTDAKKAARGAALGDRFWIKFVQMCDRLGCDPVALAAVLQNESGLNPAAQNIQGGTVAQGLNQLINPKFVGMPQDVWQKYATLSAEDQLPWVEKFFAGKVAGKSKGEIYTLNAGGFPNPDGSLYASKAYIDSRADKDKFQRPDYQQICFEQNRALSSDGLRITKGDLAAKVANSPSQAVIAAIEAARKNIANGTIPPDPPPPQAGTNEDWQTEGSANADKSQKEGSKTGDNDLNKSELGQRFQEAQKMEIQATLQELENMRNTPPLRLLVNPSSFKISSEKVVSDGNWTRNGPVVEHWGDNQDKLEASGTVAAFFAIDANGSGEGEGPGLTRVSRNYSASYHNFLSLYLLYRNNANLYVEHVGGGDGFGRNRLSLVGSIYIFYDNILYIGSFDTFNVTETAEKPYSLEYNYQFTVRATFMLDRPESYDPQVKTMFNPAGGYPPPTTSTTSDDPRLGSGVVGPDPSELAQQAGITDNPTTKQQIDQQIQDLLRGGAPPAGSYTLDPAVSDALSQGQAAPNPSQAQRGGKR